MSEPFLAEIRTFAGNFAPNGWALCQGQLLPIAQFSALFSLLGTTYGGDGKTNFALPNLQGAAPMHWGSGPGLTPRDIGESGGSPNVTVLSTQIPAHNHPATSTGSAPNLPGPQGNVLGDAAIFAAPPLDQTMASNTIGPSGGSQPHNNMAPYLAVTFIIALQGIFPPRG